MAELCDEKAKKLAEDYDGQPCGKRHKIKLEKLTYNLSQFSMEITLGDCVIDHDGTRMVQGGVIPIIVDFAGVYLARMHSSSQYITKLRRLEEDYLKPIILGQDQIIVVRALIDKIIGRKIFVNVLVENEKEELKGTARLLFIERKEFACSEPTEPA